MLLANIVSDIIPFKYTDQISAGEKIIKIQAVVLFITEL
jgi:hypothetical protein